MSWCSRSFLSRPRTATHHPWPGQLPRTAGRQAFLPNHGQSAHPIASAPPRPRPTLGGSEGRGRRKGRGGGREGVMASPSGGCLLAGRGRKGASHECPGFLRFFPPRGPPGSIQRDGGPAHLPWRTARRRGSCHQESCRKEAAKKQGRRRKGFGEEREGRRPLSATLGPKEEQRGKQRPGPGLPPNSPPSPLPPPASLVTVGALPSHSGCLRPQYFSSLLQVTLLCSKVEARFPGTTPRTRGT